VEKLVEKSLSTTIPPEKPDFGPNLDIIFTNKYL